MTIWNHKKWKQSLRIEALESRVLFANDLDLPCDVDGSGLVEPLDALVVINSINRSSTATMTPGDDSTSLRLDVNRDGVISPLDPLLIINAINRNPGDIVGNVSLDVAFDLNSNGVVVQSPRSHLES